MCPLPLAPGGPHLLAGEGVGESQYRQGDIHCGTLYTVYTVCTLWFSLFQIQRLYLTVFLYYLDYVQTVMVQYCWYRSMYDVVVYLFTKLRKGCRVCLFTSCSGAYIEWPIEKQIRPQRKTDSVGPVQPFSNKTKLPYFEQFQKGRPSYISNRLRKGIEARGLFSIPWFGMTKKNLKIFKD